MAKKQLAQSIFLGALAAAVSSAASQQAPPAISLVEPVVLTLDPTGGAASTTLVLANTGDETKLALSIGQFHNKLTGQLFSPSVTFPEEKGENKARFTGRIGSGELLPIKLEIASVSELGESVATLRNQGDEIGSITINKKPPFNVKLAVATPDNPEISLDHWKNAVLPIKNDDPVSYPIYWQVRIGDKTVDGPRVSLPANAVKQIDFYPPNAWFSGFVTGLFKENLRDGTVTLVYWPEEAKTPAASAPTKNVNVRVHLRYWPDWVRAAGWLLVFLVLAAGGATSLYVSYALPNLLRRLSTRERLNELWARIDGISSRIDSRLRVLIRVERRRLEELLYSRGILSPEYADVLSQCSDGITMLSTRVELASQLDSLREQFEQLGSSLCSPTFIDRTDHTLQEAADYLRKAQPSPSDFDAARAALAKASGLLRNLPQDPGFAKDLADRVKRLRREFEPFRTTAAPATAPPNPAGAAAAAAPALAPQPSLYESISKRLPLLFASLKPELEISTNITPPDYAEIDTNTSKLQILLEYIQLYEGANDEPFRKKLQERQESLLRWLELKSCQAFQSARMLLENMKSDVYPEDLIEELKQRPEAVSILMEPSPPTARTNQPLEFCTCFHRCELDHSAAKGQLTYYWWTTGYELPEKCWSVWSYVPPQQGTDTASIDVNVKFEYNGKPVEATCQHTFQLRNLMDSTFGERSKAEWTRLAIALMIAIFGLVAGARDQLAKLDMMSGLIAVFALGFGADQIKNIFAQAPGSAKK